MQENKEKTIEELLTDAKDYVETRIEYTRLSMVQKASKIFADILTGATVVICFVLAFLFGSVTLALFLSDVFESFTAGFGTVALIYLLIAIVVYLTKDKYIEKALTNMAIRNYFNKLADKDDEEKI